MNKICTDIKQSKKLIELEIDVNTADMYYMYRHWEIDENTIGSQSDASIGFDSDFYYSANNGKTYHYIPAWSLSALYSVMPTFTLDSSDDKHFRIHCCKKFSEWHNNPVDCCVEMILKLKEKDFL